MGKEILQIENTNTADFKKEIIEGVQNVMQSFARSLQGSDGDTLMTREETAEMLKISLVTLWQYTKQDLIPAFRIGTKIRYKKSDIMAALEKHNGFKNDLRGHNNLSNAITALQSKNLYVCRARLSGRPPKKNF